jgi:hypothetical protein
MAVGFILEFANVGQDKYEAIMKEVGLKIGSNANYPDGILTHTAGKSPNGWCVVDIWESEAAFGKFRETRLGPAFAKVGGVPEPKVTTFQVHNRFPR